MNFQGPFFRWRVGLQCRNALRACAKTTSQKGRSDLVRIWPIRLSKIAGIAGYVEILRLFLREPLE